MPVQGNDHCMPVQGNDHCMPVQGNDQCMPVQGNDHCLPVQGNDHCMPVQGNDQCDACKNVQDGPFCEAECPESTFADDLAICQPCNINCLHGCTGPNSILGEGGCNACDVVIYEADNPFCLSPGSKCPENFFKRFPRDDWTGRRYLVSTLFTLCLLLFTCNNIYAVARICYCPSVCLPVRLSVRPSVCHTGGSVKNLVRIVRIMQFSTYSSPMLLVFVR